jgi:hypothetical protein
MGTAIYPNDAIVSATAYSNLIGGVNTFTATGAVGPFPLATIVSSVHEVVVVTPSGNVVSTSTYDLVGTNQIQFKAGSAPTTGTYTLRCIDLPARYRIIDTSPTFGVSSVRYTSTSITVGGNSYNTNGSRTAFSIPEEVLGTVNNKDFLLITNNNAVQPTTAYTYPTGSNYNLVTFATAPPAANAIEIRAYSTKQQYTTRLTDMRYRKPSNGYATQTQFNVAKWSSQAGYEKRRLLSRRAKRSYQLNYTNISGVERQAIENFYSARSGEFDTFTFDLTHINQSGTVRCRFNGPIEVQQVFSKGNTIVDNFYNIRFNLQEDFD